jgi:hypothetical protein
MAKPPLYFRLSNQAWNELLGFIVECYSRRPPDVSSGRRAQIIRELHRGRRIKELSKDYRVSVRSIRQWLSAYRRAGIKGLMGKPRPGVHLTEAQIWQLIHLHSKRPKKKPTRRSSWIFPGEKGVVTHPGLIRAWPDGSPNTGVLKSRPNASPRLSSGGSPRLLGHKRVIP